MFGSIWINVIGVEYLYTRMAKLKKPTKFHLIEQAQAIVDINKFVLKESEKKLNKLFKPTKKEIKKLLWVDLSIDPKAGMNKINEIIDVLNN